MHETSALAKGNGFGTSVSQYEYEMFICALGTFLLQKEKPQIHFPLLHAPISERHPRARRQRAKAICECISLVTRGTAKGSGLGASDLHPEPPQCTCRHFLFKDRSPNSISLGYRQRPSLAM